MFKYEDYEKSAEFIKEKMGDLCPKIAIILGSGLGVLSDEFQEKQIIKYKDIPNFPISTVEGHAGELIIGKLNGKEVIATDSDGEEYFFFSAKEAGEWCRKLGLTNSKTPNSDILKACKNIKNKAFGFYWRYK